MVIGVGEVTLHLPASQSLKDKRQVVKSLIAQVQRQFSISVAEVDQQDQWQLAVIGLACVSTSARHADEVLARAFGFITVRADQAYVTDYHTEILHVF